MIKKKIKFLIIACMTFILVGCGGGIDWPEKGLATKIPKPEFGKGEISYDYDTSFGIIIRKATDDDFEDYIKECEDKGFTFIKEKSSNNFKAFNSENYNLHIYIYDDTMNINLEAPIELKEIEWPTVNKFVKVLPKPKSNIGYLNENSSDFRAIVGNVTKSDYNEYVKACQSKGFVIDYNKSEEHFDGYNKEGYHLYLDFEDDGVETMGILVYPKDDSSSSTTTDTPAKDDKIDASFKKAMDSYEEIFDEYIEFMKKYNESSDQASMLKDFTEYTKKYTKAMKDMENMKSDELNDAELEYYMEVQARITEKLLDVQ